ncbi:hypothetical protein TSUD_210050 [Trifolium subterraneum]|uniref:Uncharacterized protein n=1 Tax=Trifolium subterraneum TaxID=3900 RepID=A0A2Z6MWP1_TRISU|nr:hypothetical protein TSUD_210050 [Trifolium subterraneum]
MQHQAMKSNLVDLSSDRKRIGSRNYDQPLCPKPIRLSPSIPDFLKPIRCNKHSQQNIDEGNGVLNMIIEKMEENQYVMDAYLAVIPARHRAEQRIH